MNFNDYIKTYADLSEQVGPMVLANEIARRPLELINGDPKTEIFQFYIIQNPSSCYNTLTNWSSVTTN